MKNDQVEIKNRKTGEILICARSDVEAAIVRIMDSLKPTLQGLPYMPEY
jgi:hypothetical protein